MVEVILDRHQDGMVSITCPRKKRSWPRRGHEDRVMAYEVIKERAEEVVWATPLDKEGRMEFAALDPPLVFLAVCRQKR